MRKRRPRPPLPPRVRPLAPEQLAFFVVARTWPEIVARFRGSCSLERIREGIIHSDSDGGLELLDWSRTTKRWVLTDKGRAWVRARTGLARLEAEATWVMPSAGKGT